jgi:hypothetical protein
MDRTAADAFAEAWTRLSPETSDLMGGSVDAVVFEAFKEVRAAAHPDRIVGMDPPDFMGRGLLAHALFLGWRDFAEAEFLLGAVRQHMLGDLRENRVPHGDVYRLAHALERFCHAWKSSQSGP